MAYARAAAIIATPIGPVRIEAEGGALTGISIGEDGEPFGHDPLLDRAADELHDYFAGRRAMFDLPLAPAATARGSALRAAICSIGFGETRSYGTLALRTQSSARAVGQACARNPFPIIVPCHRVIGAEGKLGPYSAGEGPATKAWLLKHECAEDWLL